jgi:hypothetical protein
MVFLVFHCCQKASSFSNHADPTRQKPEIRAGVKGKKTVLSEADEQNITNWINGCLDRGAPCSSLDVIGTANKLLKIRQKGSQRSLTSALQQKEKAEQAVERIREEQIEMQY